LVTSEGQRRIAQPSFHKREIASLAQTMTDCTEKMILTWQQEKGQTNILNEMTKLTLEIVGKTLLSTDVSGEANEVGQALTYVIKYVNDRIIHPFNLPPKLPTPKNIRFAKYNKTLYDVVMKIIKEHRSSKIQHNDMLTMLINARDEETGEGMTDQQLMDEVMTIFLAGHETTANALAWTWYLLARHDDVRKKLNMELNDVLNDKTPTIEDIPKLTYTTQIIQESMRLYPPAWIIGRRAVGMDNVGGFDIPPNSDIMIAPYIMHHHPKLWDDPEKFDPDRFSVDAAKNRDKYAYFPFGGGQRICIGNNFAMMEMQLLVAMIAQKV